MIASALLVYLGVQVGAPGWYYVLVGVMLAAKTLKLIIDVAKGE